MSADGPNSTGMPRGVGTLYSLAAAADRGERNTLLVRASGTWSTFCRLGL
jgi:hypothetical protein